MQHLGECTRSLCRRLTNNMNPNDKIREQILEYFYDRNANATSRMGKKGSAIKVSAVKSELKDRYGLSQKEVMSNLTYLIDNGWIKTIDVQKTINVKGNLIPQVTTFYEIDATGIDKIEGGSQFEPRARFEGINITATGQNIITLGDGNVVNAEFTELHQALGELKDAITASDELEERDKLDVVVDIESIRDQLAKSQPDKPMLKSLWGGLQRIATVSGAADAFGKATALIGPLIGV